MDAARMPEPKVTATSKNTFSSRDTIDTAYNKADADGGDQKLRDSRFWYHAELIAADRLRRLLATVRAPDLVKVTPSRTRRCSTTISSIPRTRSRWRAARIPKV